MTIEKVLLDMPAGKRFIAEKERQFAEKERQLVEEKERQFAEKVRQLTEEKERQFAEKVRQLAEEKEREIKAETIRSTIARVLHQRFGSVPEELALQLRAIEAEPKLDHLVDVAAVCPDVAAFRKVLDEALAES